MNYNRLVQLASGTCIKIDNALSSRVKSIAFELEKDKKYEDHFNIYNEREQELEGNVYSDNNRVEIGTKTLSGKTCDILFSIDTTNLKDGDEIAGLISIISNVGTLQVPFKYIIITNAVDRAISKLNTIIDYYDLLNENFDLAKKIFSLSNFKKSKFLKDEFTMSLYEGLIKSSNVNLALIEFFKAFDIDVTKQFSQVDDEMLNRYIDDTLDNINLDNIKNNQGIVDAITFGNEIIEKEKKENEINTEINSLVDNLIDKELLNVLASMCVRNNFTNKIAFKIYLKVIERGSDIGGIYDKFLLSIPDDYSYKLPLYIYRYYYDDKTYSFEDKAKLYENIIATFDEKDSVYEMYMNEILEYAISRIYQNRITESLVKIYNKVLSTTLINENNCNNVLYLLRSHKVIVNNSKIRKIVIRYAETEKETKYDVINGIAYVPIFFDSYIMIYEDVYGNRFYNEDASIKALFERKDLEKYIIENFEQKEIIDMTKIIKLNEAMTINNEYEIDEIRDLENKININTVIREKYKEKIIDFYYRQALNAKTIRDGDKIFLLKLPFDNMTDDNKKKILVILMQLHEYKFVYNKIMIFGFDLLSNEDLALLFSKCIDFANDLNKEKLLNDIFAFTKTRLIDAKLCNFLALNYDGPIENLVLIMDSLNKLKIDSSNVAKKIVMYSLECNDIKYLDHAYNYCALNELEEINIEVAYLNKKATDYFLDEKDTSIEFFDKLIKYMSIHFEEIDKSMPIIFLFAITKYISTIKLLVNNEYRRVLIKVMDRLLKTDYVFAYYKKLNRHIRMPYNIMNKEYIEYHADKDFVPKAVLTISGNNEKKEVELNKIFMNIYVKKVTVFKNEIINFEIINSTNPAMGILASGVLKYDDDYDFEYPKNGRQRSNFDYINDAIVNLDRENLDGLKKVVIEMIEKQEISKELFSI